MTVDIEWFHDCGGKKSCDTVLVRTETRYWPAGYGASVYKDGKMQREDDGSKPNGIAGLTVNGSEFGLTREFVGDTEAQVMTAMEAWTNEMAEFIHATLREAFLKHYGHAS